MVIKNYVQDKIDPRVIPLIFMLTIIEFKLFGMSEKVFLTAGRDSWLSALLGGTFITWATYFFLCLMKRFPEQNFLEYIARIWGKPLALIISCGYLLFWGSFLTLLFNNTAEVNQMFFLEKTPVLLPVSLLAIGAVWLVSYGFSAIIRFMQITGPLFIIPLLIAIPLTLSEIEVGNFFPILANGIIPVLKGAVLYAGYFHGLEVLLFLSPFFTDPAKAFKPALVGIIFLNLLAFIFTILAIGVLGINNTNQMLWPGFAMLSIIEIPGFPAERFELLLTVPLLTTAFIAISVTLYLLSYGFMQLFKISHKKTVIYLMALLTVFAKIFIPDFAWSIKIREIHLYAGIIFIYLLPLITLLLAGLRKKGEYS
ncbi:MAG: GerAB/ArcD/ProY family transporter [Peptococcaceae bacterium]